MSFCVFCQMCFPPPPALSCLLVESLLFPLPLVNSLVCLLHNHTHTHTRLCIIPAIYVPAGSESDISKTGFSLAARKRNEPTDRLGTWYDVNTQLLIAHSDTEHQSPPLRNISVTLLTLEHKLCWRCGDRSIIQFTGRIFWGCMRVKTKHLIWELRLLHRYLIEIVIFPALVLSLQSSVSKKLLWELYLQSHKGLARKQQYMNDEEVALKKGGSKSGICHLYSTVKNKEEKTQRGLSRQEKLRRGRRGCSSLSEESLPDLPAIRPVITH